MAGKLRVLIVTQLFPNAVEPWFAAFNRQQFASLAELADVTVLGVIPWFPGVGRMPGRSTAVRFAKAPGRESIAGMTVEHPRVLFVPKVGHAVSPALYALSLYRRVRQLRDQIDVILGSWAYPDGIAVVALGALMSVPTVVKLHGSDLNVVAELRGVRPLLRTLLPRAQRVVAVSRPLADKAIALGVRASRVAVVPNGVDRTLFSPRDRSHARSELAAAATSDMPLFAAGDRLLLYVGRLEKEKGVLDLLAAFERLAADEPTFKLALVGAGTVEDRCRALANRFPGRVLLPGSLPLADVARWVGACDVLTLPSWNEGTPNVLLEALAAGRRVVATNVGGIPDVIRTPRLGELVPARDIDALAEALRRAAHTTYDPAELTAAAPPDWSESAARLYEVLAAAAAARGVAVAAPSAVTPPFPPGAPASDHGSLRDRQLLS